MADPNAPEPQVSVDASSANVRFRSCRVVDEKKPTGIRRALALFSKPSSKFEETLGTLRFAGCSRWRWDSANDHDWYKADGHGRYSGVAPRWGEFYELIGPDPDRETCLGKRSVQTPSVLGIFYTISAMKRSNSWPRIGLFSQVD
ncbi:hypothetical protein [Rhizobium sp. NFACC06-2]|uniref:hypothetical protein n=1 Tax=Rhizobium sp. NFACC06-2 TaxID=1566264 RepID=UPI002570DB7E|nr:hypothetical protein [Rhizobium sp. NFACC06-2]